MERDPSTNISDISNKQTQTPRQYRGNLDLFKDTQTAQLPEVPSPHVLNLTLTFNRSAECIGYEDLLTITSL